MSVHAAGPDLRLIDTLPHSPAAERNAAPIAAVLAAWLPAQARAQARVRVRVLEVASGTGQHAAHIAAAQPGWDWQPTEAGAEALPFIAARCAGLVNVRAPLRLDVMAPTWPMAAAAADARSDAEIDAAFDAAFDLVYVANLLHIAPWACTPALMRGAARCLAPGGALCIYGPFVVEGEPLAPSNAAFDADLRGRDSRWGLRALAAVEAAAAAAGLALAERRVMPANNLLLRFVTAA